MLQQITSRLLRNLVGQQQVCLIPQNEMRILKYRRCVKYGILCCYLAFVSHWAKQTAGGEVGFFSLV